MIMNKKMKELMRRKQTNKFIFNSNIESLFLPSFRKIYDCIIISDDQLKLNAEDFTRMIIKKGNKSGYEYSCNETLINFYVDDYSDVKDLIFIGTMIIDIWGKQLKLFEFDSTFCFILSVDEGSDSVSIFFHKFRDEEGLWISEDLELFNQPVGYQLI